MNAHDWPLVLFTILAQMSVGSFWVLGIVHYSAKRQASVEEADRMSDYALLAIGPVLALGLLASLLHLGNPLNAYRAIFNLGSSWLSMEILSGVLFAGLGALFTLMQWRKIGSFAMRNVVALITALIGFWLVYSMARVYMLSTIPTWNIWTTPVTFFTTTLLLGSLAVGVAFVANYGHLRRQKSDNAPVQGDLLRNTMRWITVAAVVLLGVEFVVIPLHYAYLATESVATTEAVRLLLSQYGFVLMMRLLFVFIGAGLLAVFGYRNAFSPGREALLGQLAYAGFALVFVSEVMGRFLFYASYANIGL